MLKDQLKKLFAGYDPAIQAVIDGVIRAEQDHISEERPHVKDEIDYIINLVANKQLKGASGEKAKEH